MLRTTVGQLLINEALPAELRDYNRTLDKKGIADLFQQVAERYPDQYRQVAKRLSDVGRDVSYTTAGFSFGLRHLRPARAALRVRAEIQQKLDAIQHSSLDDDAKSRKLVETVRAYQKPLEDAIFEESKAEGNPLALQIMSGARGNASNLKSLRGGDLLYVDHHGREIPIPVLHSYSEGLSPAEYWAGVYGARKGVLDTKRATQDAGYLAKQLNQATHRLIVTALDDDNDPDNNLRRGLPVDTDDPDNVGALLALPTAGYPRNTRLTPKIIKDIKAQGVSRMLVRSPITGGPKIGGVYARDVGIRERGLPPLGDYVGIAAAQALSEKLTQGQLSSKHSGGVAGNDAAVSGFKFINSLIQVPKHFPVGATHAQMDGKVQRIAPAPQGGFYVDVGDYQHYVDASKEVTVKPGDELEAGDVLSSGIPNPSEIVRHKGIGEGRRYFVTAMRDAYKRSGMQASRRNIELLSRGLIDRIELTDEYDDYVPGDVIPYNALESDWQPREGTRAMSARDADGKYLEQPVLHYSIGTKLRPSVIKQLGEFGVESVSVHDDPPPFKPVMVRGAALLQSDPDFLTRHLGSNLQRGTLDAAARGGTSNMAGTSFVPAMLQPNQFGRQGLTQGWKPGKSLLEGL